ncbi:unnamed protein product, partial [Cochlearia groenlandica]
RKRVRDDSDGEDLDSTEVKRLRHDLFDDSYLDSASLDLDSVIKSFESELSSSSTAEISGENQPDIGYLLEASDDELGLPPPPPGRISKEEETTEILRASSDSSGFDDLWGFDEHVVDYGGLDLGSVVEGGGDYVDVERLFEFSGSCYDSGDLFSWRSESLPAE